MPEKSTTDALFAFGLLMEKHVKVQRELHCVFMFLKKAYNSVPRKELQHCLRKAIVTDKFVSAIQGRYEDSRTMVKCAVVFQNNLT